MPEVKLYLPSHISKYLVKSTGGVHDVVHVNKSKHLKELILLFLDVRHPRNFEVFDSDLEEITVLLPNVWVKDGGFDLRYKNFYISKNKMKRLSVILEGLLRAELNAAVQYGAPPKGRKKTKQIILDFCDFWGITEQELSYETLKKWIYRRVKEGKVLGSM